SRILLHECVAHFKGYSNTIFYFLNGRRYSIPFWDARKLKTSLIYLMFTHMCLINILDLSFSVLLSLVYIANGTWVFGTHPTELMLASRKMVSCSSGAPLGYSLCRLFIYTGCLCVLLVCASAVFKKRVSFRFSYDHFKMIQLKFSLFQVALLVCIFIAVEGPYISLCFIVNSYDVTSDGLVLDIPQDADTLITWLKFLFPLLSPIILCWCSDISGYLKELFCCRSYDPPVIGQIGTGYKGEPFNDDLTIELDFRLTQRSGPGVNASSAPKKPPNIFPEYELVESNEKIEPHLPTIPLHSLIHNQVYQCRLGLGVGAMPGVMTLVATPEGLQLKLPSSVASPPDPIRLPQPSPDPQPYEGSLFLLDCR
ncbi:unnamed protein product, partial [Heligmosomoides polygyrus]